MIQLSNGGIYLVHGKNLIPENEVKKVESILGRKVDKEEAHKGTIAYRILEKHNQSSDMKHLKIKFDALTSHDITYVGIIQTAKASGMDKFPMPYILTCCHNSLGHLLNHTGTSSLSVGDAGCGLFKRHFREPLGAPPCLGQTGEEQGAAEPCSCLYVHHAMHAVHCIAVHCILWTA